MNYKYKQLMFVEGNIRHYKDKLNALFRLKTNLKYSGLLEFVIIFVVTLASSLILKPITNVSAAACGASVATISRTSSPVFYIDTGYTYGYVSYKITTGASGSFNDLWIKADTFSSANLQLASSEDGLYRIGSIGSSSSATAYFYLNGAATGTAQTFTLRLYEGKPGSGGVENCTSSQSISSVSSTIQASANKVTSVNYTAPYLGGDFTMTVIGDTGTIGGTNEFYYTPATQSTWNADCLELKDTSITLTGGNTGTYTNGLYLSGLGSATTHYVLNYTFKAKCVTASSTAVVPLNYISSGGSLKHTNTTNYGTLPPIEPAINSVSLNKTVSPAYSQSGGTATYSIDIKNEGASSATLDDIVDTLPSSPANATYVNNSATYDNDISDAVSATSLANPSVSGQTLTWIKQFVIASGKTARLTFHASIPSTAGSYTNSVLGHIGTTQIDKTVLTTDNLPATVTYGVGSISLSSSTKTATDVNGGTLQPGDVIDYTIDIYAQGTGTANGVAVSDTISTYTQSLSNIVIGANGSNCGTSYVNNSTATQINITNMDVATGSHCYITYKTTVKSDATNGSTVLNTATITLTNPGGIGATPSSAPLTVQRTPQLAITIADNDADNIVLGGQTVTYTITVSNTGQATANGVDLTSTITAPAGGSLGTPNLTNCGSQYVDTSALPTVSIASLSIAVGTPCVITYTYTVASGATSGQINDSADITAAREGGNDPTAVNASTLLINAAPTPPSLSGTITENDTDNFVEPSQKITYTLTITNSGQTDATTSAVVTVDSRYLTPTNKIYSNCGTPSSNYSAPSLNFTSISVPAGATCTMTYDVTLTSPINQGTSITEVFDIAAASQGGNNPSAIDAQILTVNATPILSIAKSSNVSGALSPSQSYQYTLTISNTGNGDATGVNLTDTITGDISYVSSFNLTNCGSSYTNNTTGIAINITNLQITTTSNCIISYTATVSSTPTVGSTISNTASVSASTEGSNTPQPASTGPYSIQVLPSLSVTKTENDADNIVTIGQVVTYTVTISNSSSATGTTSFTDTIPTGFGAPSNVQFSNCGASPSSSFSSPTLSATNLAVTNANSCVITFNATVQASVTNGQTLSNTVDVAQSSEGGNNPAPVSASTLTVSALPDLSTSTHSVSDLNGGNPVPGDTLRYTVTVINTGNKTGTGISLTNTIDTDTYNITNVQYTNCGTPTNSSTSTYLNITNITTTTTTNCVITYDVTIKTPTNEGSAINSTATISPATEGGPGASPSASTLTVDATPNMAITTTSNPVAGNVVRGQKITYTTTISNTGNGQGTVNLTGTVTGSVSNISNINLTNCGSSYTNSTSGLNLNITSLVVGTSTNCVITYEVTVSGSAADASTITNTTDINAASEGGNDASATALITHTVILPNLSVTKAENDSDNLVSIGQKVTYTIAIANSKNVNATTSLADPISSGFDAPTNIQFTSCGGSPLSSFSSSILSVSNIVVSGINPCIITYDVTVSSGATNGQLLLNTVDVDRATEGGNDPAQTSATTLTVDNASNVSFTTTSNPVPSNIYPGTVITYTTSIANTGVGPATLDLTGNMTGQASSISNINYSNCGSSMTNYSNGTNLDIQTLKISGGSSCIVTYDSAMKSDAKTGDAVSIITDLSAPYEGGSDPSPTSALTHNAILPNLAVTVTDSSATNVVKIGDIIQYSIAITNSGSSKATTSAVDTISDGFDKPYDIVFTNCGSNPTYTINKNDINFVSLEINTSGLCTISYLVVVSSTIKDSATLKNNIDIARPTEGGNDPSIINFDDLKVSVPVPPEQPTTPPTNPIPTPPSDPKTPTIDTPPTNPEPALKPTDNPKQKETTNPVVAQVNPLIENKVWFSGAIAGAVTGGFMINFLLGTDLGRRINYWFLVHRYPHRIKAKKYGFNAKIDEIHLSDLNEIKLSDDTKHASWVKHSVDPGDRGVSVLMGDATEKQAFANIGQMQIGDNFEVRMHQKDWIQFEIKDIRFVSEKDIRDIFHHHIPRINHQLNIVGKLVQNHPGGSWILVETEEINK